MIAAEGSIVVNAPISADQFIDVLNRSTLGQRRPVDDRECIEGMDVVRKIQSYASDDIRRRPSVECTIKDCGVLPQ